MEVLSVDFARPAHEAIHKAVSLLATGGIIVYPTDTVYGLGVDATNGGAVKRLIALKERPQEKAISVLMADMVMVKAFCEVSRRQEALLRKHLPGPFTFILKKRAKVALYGSGETVGVRIISEPGAYALVSHLGKPITATSANKSGQAPARSFNDFKDQFRKDLPSLFLDAGRLPERSPSTVVDLTRKRPTIIRQGEAKFPR